MDMKLLLKLNIKGNDTISQTKFDELQEALPHCQIKHDELLFSLRFGERDYRSDAERIDANNLGVSDLTGLEKFGALRIANFNGNSISDLSPLQELKKLEELRLNDNAVSDVSPLSGMRTLRKLELKNNAVRTLAPLAGCSALTELYLNGNGITDISALSFLTNLTTLDLTDNAVSDLSALYGLSSLQVLGLRGNSINADDIAALKTMLPNCTILYDVAESGGETGNTPSPVPSSDSDLR